MKKIIYIFLILIISQAMVLALPSIENVEVVSKTDTSVIITWRTTNEASSTAVEYGIGSLYSTHTETGANTAYHQAEITGLYPNMIYQFRVKSAGTNETSYSETAQFQTLERLNGQPLFTFAVMADIQYTENLAPTSEIRGRPYSTLAQQIANKTATEINAHSPNFTLVLGDLPEEDDPAAGDEILTELKPALFDNLTSSYYVIPGNHDKVLSYTGGNWIDKNIGSLDNYAQGYGTADANTDSVYNYGFDSNGFHIVMLDSVISTGVTRGSGSVNTTWLENHLTANSGKKTFVFVHHPTYNVSQEGMGVDIPAETYGGLIVQMQIANYTAFQSVINNHSSDVIGVVSGHIHDNFKTTINGIPYVRIASLCQFPVGYAVYKVYSNGYMQTFYKTDAQYSELARNYITSGEGHSAKVWQQVWLGSNSARNFVHTFSPTTQEPYTPPPDTGNPFGGQGSVQSFTNNITTDNTPTFVGIATDETYGISSVECRIDGGAFYAATPLDGRFSGTLEVSSEGFMYTPASELARGLHTLEIKFKDGIGNTTPNGSYLSYGFRVMGESPIVNLYINQNTMVDGDPIPGRPSIEAAVTSTTTLDTITLFIDNGTGIPLTKVLDPTNSYINYGYYKPTTALADGTHTIRVQGTDIESRTGTKEVTNLSVDNAGDTIVQSVPLNYPNPFDPTTDSTNISYVLSKDSNITVSIHTAYGTMIWKQAYPAGEAGGRVGYNEVSWNGKTSSGATVGNSMYIYVITSGNKLLAKGKLVAFKR